MGNTSRLRPMLEAGQSLWMVNPGCASIDVIDMLAGPGVKCVFIDCERTAVGVESITVLARCAQSHGMAALARSESERAEILVRYLDRGIDGIVVPHVETVEQAHAIADVVRYATRNRPQQIFTIAQIESVQAVANPHDLAACDGIDGFLIGLSDLSHSLGFAGDTSQPGVSLAIGQAIDALLAKERIWGLPALPDSARHWTARGARLLYCTLEQILKNAFGAYAAGVQQK